jgi:hypothetical protein
MLSLGPDPVITVSYKSEQVFSSGSSRFLKGTLLLQHQLLPNNTRLFLEKRATSTSKLVTKL